MHSATKSATSPSIGLGVATAASRAGSRASGQPQVLPERLGGFTADQQSHFADSLDGITEFPRTRPHRLRLGDRLKLLRPKGRENDMGQPTAETEPPRPLAT